jgi:hypothetical protein
LKAPQGKNMDLILVLTGALLAFIAQNIFFFKTENVSIVNDYIKIYSDIEDYATKYWLCDCESNKDSLFLNFDCISHINGMINASGHFYETAQNVLGKYHNEFVEIDQNLFDLVTGGEYESKNKKRDINRAIEIITKCNEMKALLHKSRRAQFWAK